MDMETLNNANALQQTIIKSEERLAILGDMKDSEEIIVVVNKKEIEDALNDMYFHGGYRKPLYYQGNLKDKVMQALIDDMTETRDECLKEFEEL